MYGGGLYKMEPKELERLSAEPVVEAMGGWSPGAAGKAFCGRLTVRPVKRCNDRCGGLQGCQEADPSFGNRHGWEAKAGIDFCENLEATYIVRMYAEFEAGLRDYWKTHLKHDTHPTMLQLVRHAIPNQMFSQDTIDDADAVREYRNYLVHDIEDEVPEGVRGSRSRRPSAACARISAGWMQDGNDCSRAKTCARNCAWKCQCRNQTPVDPRPAPAIPPEARRAFFLPRAKEAVRAEHGFGGCLQTGSGSVHFSTAFAAQRPFRLLLIAFGQDLPGPGIDDIVRAAAFTRRV
jgi:hypothetical protein